jgi:hypothetical protein
METPHLLKFAEGKDKKVLPWGMQLELVSYPAGMAVLRDAAGALWSPRAP